MHNKLVYKIHKSKEIYKHSLMHNYYNEVREVKKVNVSVIGALIFFHK